VSARAGMRFGGRASPQTATVGWDELDRRAVDTVRVLAADAVEKVGNGHPGTAISLAPVAYLLFQHSMRIDPSDEHWHGRDRFVLSCGHSSLTQYIQLYLSGYGLELTDLGFEARGTLQALQESQP
jgi:transketolase